MIAGIRGGEPPVQAGFVQRGSLPFGASLRGLKARGNPEQEATPWIASLRSQ